MSGRDSNLTLALFLDLENIAHGVSAARFPPFDITRIFDRLLVKGNIVLKKAYCDFDRFKDLKHSLHEAAFELIEIPHVRRSGKNSADIRMVVDALDVCYTNTHVDSFAIISGDSDFSPLVSKLRENGKAVIGVGVRNSTAALFISNCDEFIYYDDLVTAPVRRTRKRATPPAAGEASPPATPAPARNPERGKLIDRVVATVAALTEARGDEEPIWASMVKQALKRRDPGFNERASGFASFTELLREAEQRGLVVLAEKQGNCQVRLVE